MQKYMSDMNEITQQFMSVLMYEQNTSVMHLFRF